MIGKREDTKKKLYTKKNWYINTYNALGSEWLVNSIRKINPHEGFVFASFSANAAYYEDDAYKAIKDDYTPYFYVGDLFAEELTNKKVESHDEFKYLSGQRDASTIEKSMIDNHKIDILLDCKGALWYATRLGYSKKEEAIRLLKKYRELLDFDGVLLIDYYDHHIIDSIWFELRGGNRKKTRVKCFGEESTKKHLQSVFGKDFVYGNCREILIGDSDKTNFSSKMGTAIISVSAIDEMLERLQNDKSIEKKYKVKKLVNDFCFQMLPKILYGLLAMLLVILLVTLVICWVK